MNQEELASGIAKRFFLTKVESHKILNFIFTEMTNSLNNGRRVFFRDLGSFTKGRRAPKRVIDPKTKKPIIIPEHFTVTFHPTKSLLQKIK